MTNDPALSRVPVLADFRRLIRVFLCLLASAPAGSAVAQVGSAPQTGEAAEKESPQAMVRAFIVPAESGKTALQMIVKPQRAGADVAPLVVASTDGAAVFGSSYLEAKSGGAVVELRSGDKVLASDAVAFKPERAFTLVAWQEPSGWQLKAFPDDPASPNASDRAVRVLNFPAGRETLLSVDRAAETKVPPNRVQELRAPAKLVGVTVKVLAKDGAPPALSTLEMDFATLKSGYIVVVPDNFGRMRPQFIGGGYEKIEATAAAPAVASAPVTPEQERTQRMTAARMEIDQQETVLKMIKAREAAMGNNANATLLENKREAEKKLAELKKSLEAARTATPPSQPPPAPGVQR